jgi:murein L,D-transpeptidase YcbB/YkuD
MNRILFLSLFIPWLWSCGINSGDPAAEKPVVEEDPEKINLAIDEFLNDKIKSWDTSKTLVLHGDTLHATKWMWTFYKTTDFKHAWSDQGKRTATGDSLYALINRAEDYGLIPEDYHLYIIDSLYNHAFDSAGESYNITNLAQTDILLSDAFFTFCVHVSAGRVMTDTSEHRSWKPQRLDSIAVSLLQNVQRKESVTAIINLLEPKHREYHAVKRHMNEYRKANEGVIWDELPDSKDTMRFLEAVKKRLIITGLYDSLSTEKDSIKLATALKSFQKARRLEQDGKMGRNTLIALKMTINSYVQQMAINLERWRLERPEFAKRYMLVNLPAFNMRVYEEDTLVMESRIVCGAVKTQTPQLDSKMYEIVLYPYWNVPYSIAWKEILPLVKRDTAYLRKHRYEVLDRNGKVVDPNVIPWKKYGKGNLPYRFRQKIGDDNALGVMKFEFHNKHGVYMHDTNAPSYFRRETRAYSHGCMRLEKYMNLAHFLIRDDSVRIPKDTFDLWTQRDTQRRVALRKPLPIHVRYYTCDVDTGNVVFVWNDIYGRDEFLIRVIYGESNRNRKKAPAKPTTKAALFYDSRLKYSYCS